MNPALAQTVGVVVPPATGEVAAMVVTVVVVTVVVGVAGRVAAGEDIRQPGDVN